MPRKTGAVAAGATAAAGSFNEAAARCRGKPSVRDVIGRLRIEELQ